MNIDKFDIYVSHCDNSKSHKIGDLEQEHDLDHHLQPNGEWCKATDVDDLIKQYNDMESTNDDLQNDLDDLQKKYDKLFNQVDEVLSDADGNSVRGYYMIDDNLIDELQHIFDTI